MEKSIYLVGQAYQTYFGGPAWRTTRGWRGALGSLRFDPLRLVSTSALRRRASACAYRLVRLR